jgi:hypothetical protein
MIALLIVGIWNGLPSLSRQRGFFESRTVRMSAAGKELVLAV